MTSLSLKDLPSYLRLKALLEHIDSYRETDSFYLADEKILSDDEIEFICKIIRKLPNLKQINLARNQIDDDQLFKLFRALPLTLESLNLSNNKFSDYGVGFIFQQLTRFKYLRVLYLYGCNC